MEEIQNKAMSIDWDQMLEILRTQGVELAINVAVAIAIFYIGKLVVSMVVRGMRKVMRAREVDKTLETFVSNLVRISLMVVFIIAAISQVGIETTSFIAIFGAAGAVASGSMIAAAVNAPGQRQLAERAVPAALLLLLLPLLPALAWNSEQSRGYHREVGAWLAAHIPAGTGIAGAVLQQVDLKRYGRFGYGDSGYYYHYGRYGKYYSS